MLRLTAWLQSLKADVSQGGGELQESVSNHSLCVSQGGGELQESLQKSAVMSVEQYEATPVELMHGVAIATPLHPARWLMVNNGDDHCLSLLESAVELSNRGMHKLALRECR